MADDKKTAARKKQGMKLLGTGMARKAGKDIKGRTSRIDAAINAATGRRPAKKKVVKKKTR